ncbi:MAG TPA: sulfotransferase [Sphingomonadales bacterium]|nr:sulfotransferase [Sphingomonadales bacterium]
MSRPEAPSTVHPLLDTAAKALRFGRRDEARSALLQAADLAAGDAALLEEIARSLEDAADREGARRVYKRCLLTDPDRYLAHSRLGAIQFENGEIEEATFHLERANTLKPGDPAILNNLGLLYEIGDKPERAIETLTRALEKGAPEDFVKGTLAGIYEDSNLLEPLKALLDEALPKFPGDFYLNLIAAKLKRREGDLEGARTRLEGLDPSHQPNDAQVIYHFEMGRILDAAGDYEKAFTHFETGNRLSAAEPSFRVFDKKRAREQVRMLDALDLSSWKTPAAEEGTERAPAFLIGFPRSGTTLLTQVLDAHPALEVLEEKPILARLTLLLDEEAEPFPKGLETLSAAKAASLRAHYAIHADTLRKRDPSRLLVDKFPLHILDVPLIAKLFPRAKMILALRHPCDVVLSCFMQNFGPNAAMLNFLTLEDATAYYAAVMALWQKFRREIPLEVLEIRYERIVENLEREARALVTFLGLPWDEAVLSYRERAMAKARINTPSYHQVIKPIYREAVGRWRHYEPFLKPYVPRLAPFCRDFGYEL